jgi:hypothetical protein
MQNKKCKIFSLHLASWQADNPAKSCKMQNSKFELLQIARLGSQVKFCSIIETAQ